MFASQVLLSEFLRRVCPRRHCGQYHYRTFGRRDYYSRPRARRVGHGATLVGPEVSQVLSYVFHRSIRATRDRWTQGVCSEQIQFARECEFSPLSWDGDLCRMARAHSEKMARLGFFAHQTPEGLRLKDRARAAGLRFQVIGENIAYNQGVDDPGTFAVQRWMISSGHRANILSREFRSSGIGSFVAGDGRVYLTQIFIAP